MMKILRIITRMNIGGPAFQILSLQNHFYTVLITGGVPENESDISGKIKNKIYIPHLVREISPLKDCTAFMEIYETIKREQPDIVHTHTSKAGMLGRLATILYNIDYKRDVKIVHTFHGNVFHDYFGKLKTKAIIQIERWLAKGTDAIIAISSSQLEELWSNGIFGKKNYIVPLGFDLDKFKIVRSKTDIFTIGTVGRMTDIKNQKLFLEAALEFIKVYHNIPVKFILYGDGELREELEAFANKYFKEGQVVFKGWERDQAEMYSNMDLFVLTSKNEGTPVTIIEAMVSKVPVVATKAGGVGDLLRNGRGLLCESDAKTLAHEFYFVYCYRGTGTIDGIKENAYNYVMERHTKERLVKNLNKIYKNIL